MKDSIETIIPAILDKDFNLSIPIIKQGKVIEDPDIDWELAEAIGQFINQRKDPDAID